MDERYSKCKSIIAINNAYIIEEGSNKISAESVSGESIAITLYDITTKKGALAFLCKFDVSKGITVDNVVDEMLKDNFFKDCTKEKGYTFEATRTGNKSDEKNINKIKEKLQKHKISIIGEDLKDIASKSKYVYLDCDTGNVEVYHT